MLNRFTGFLRRNESKENNQTEIDILLKKIDFSRLPVHVAIIMDGNGRWANRRGLPRAFGHRAGVESLRDIVKICSELKIKVLTVYAFSTENWKRPQEEVNVLMDLLVEYLNDETEELCKNGVRINPIGRLQDMPVQTLEALRMAAERSRNNDGLILNVAVNYGGRTEIIDAVRAIAAKVKDDSLNLEQVDDKVISNSLYTAGQPDPDLLIRPSGDFRISNFLLWQLAYTEFWLTNVLWPDFRRVHLLEAIVEYQRRERRFGGLKSGRTS
ncbi:isoprenyl transferase [Pelotomaculum propionicicum]|uniref:Isoprenyl transferase n=1 Tax=Pelotomaculum propionicicum TaxID=258475 RepID=A0A4Y7RPC7_9FIRM|nr:isoprenyl transferase [Pelotomaculum propionicicum]NLI11955.1 isoprenyl transferase [Peptococcaceae bacterium]TEB10167.1 Isoprenyl transferase [Pelotomaculum propionicicum]